MAAPTGTVDVPVAGKVKKQYVYYGAAGLAALVGYKWWTARAVAEDNAPTFGDGYDEFGNLLGADPGMVTPGSDPGLTDRTPTTAPFAFNNNPEWTQWVVSYLTDRGVDSGLALGAIGDFLGRRPLSAKEQEWVRGALAAAGPPPQGGPFDIIPESAGTVPPPSQALTAPRPVATSVQRTAVTFKWIAVPGATGYYVSRDGGGRGVFHPSSDRSHTSRGLKPNTSYTFRIRAAKGTKPNEVVSAAGTLSVRTKK
jgi:hypothetical protein